MEYRFEKLDLGRGVQVIKVVFEESQYQLFTEYFAAEVGRYPSPVEEALQDVLSGREPAEMLDGNLFHTQIDHDYTTIVLDVEDEADKMRCAAMRSGELARCLEALRKEQQA